ncbi:MAG: hypothetical protein WBZ45_03210 [Acidimicrobiia bacterium]
MSRYALTMFGGITMTAVCGGLLLLWLQADTGAGEVGLLWIFGILVGLSVFAGGAIEAMRSENRRPEQIRV